MKLFFDARYIRTDYPDGISRYTHELAWTLSDIVALREDSLALETTGIVESEAAPEDSSQTLDGKSQRLSPRRVRPEGSHARESTSTTTLTYIISDKKQLHLLPKDAKYVKIHPVTSYKEPFTALILNKFHPDVVATPLQSMGSFGRKFKLILNQQDMTYYKHATPPSYFPWYVRLAWRIYHLTYWPGRWTLNAADIVATVSETSKKEIEAAHLTKRPIIVVPNAARDLSEFLKTPVVQHDTPPRNLVFMGSLLPHKNPLTLVRAMEFLPGRTLHLLSRGSASYITELKQVIPKNANVKFYGGVSDEEYANILADDAIMVSASKSEGFGLPLAEALKINVPCVVSDIPPFHEVAGKGALFASPNDPKDFATKIKQLDDKAEREKLIKIGHKHVDTFSWQKSAKVLLDAAEELAEKS